MHATVICKMARLDGFHKETRLSVNLSMKRIPTPRICIYAQATCKYSRQNACSRGDRVAPPIFTCMSGTKTTPSRRPASDASRVALTRAAWRCNRLRPRCRHRLGQRPRICCAMIRPRLGERDARTPSVELTEHHRCRAAPSIRRRAERCRGDSLSPTNLWRAPCSRAAPRGGRQAAIQGATEVGEHPGLDCAARRAAQVRGLIARLVSAGGA